MNDAVRIRQTRWRGGEMMSEQDEQVKIQKIIDGLPRNGASLDTIRTGASSVFGRRPGSCLNRQKS
jgi:hypothetical protein